MEKVEFSVGAKAARLIGRENIADVDGALIELIKNSYDADASCVLVHYIIPFLDIPSRMSNGFLASVLSDEDYQKVISYYSMEEGGVLKKKELTEDENKALGDVLSSYNRIIVADNGSGMSYETVISSWMYIGTSDKESNFKSKKGRIKTGAKGIGRFALDKLSRNSKMYTKSESSETTIAWSMDWEQFANVRLISEVEASIDKIEDTYRNIIYRYFVHHKKVLDDYDWTYGTLIELSPTREQWNRRLFKKVNTNLRSINPIGQVDKFDVVVINELYPEFNFKTESVAIDPDDYDYRIRIQYDGKTKYKVCLQRNEVDFSVRKVLFEKYGRMVEKQVDEFWQRPAFACEKYTKNKYNTEIVLDYNVEELFPDDSAEKVKMVGGFSTELYFMRLDNSDKYPIMKNASRTKRKSITEKFSGIKIYRDSFKVRPYGDEGALFDWLGLSVRAQRSPSGVADTNGAWKVQPYQIIGWVSIGRESNPFLEDMANREGLALNDFFYIFRDLIIKGISEFEYDRQYIYREYARWKKDSESELSTQNNYDEVIAASKKWKTGNTKEEWSNKQEEKHSDVRNNGFSDEDFFGTVQRLVEESDQRLNDKQILQVLSSSGIILNTFFHEFNAINTQFHVEAPQIRSRVRYILNNQEYSGIPAYNPFQRLDALEKNDRVTAAFLDVVMEGVKKENLQASEIKLHEEIEKIIKQWALLMEEKHISVNYSYDIEEKVESKWRFSKVDLYIIINNFMLNSAWFLEETRNLERKINCDLRILKSYYQLTLSNNGPPLDAKYKYNPNKVFEIGETTKTKKMKDETVVEGTGLGLWILKETVERNNGTVDVVDEADGFSLRIVVRR